MELTRSRLLLVLGVVLAVVSAGAMLGAATAADLSIDASSDLDEGETVQDFTADSEENSSLIINVDGDAHDIEEVDIEITYEEMDDGDTEREMTVYTADLDSDDYEGVQDEGTTDELHEWEIDHDAFEEVPGEVGDDVDLNVSVETVNAEDGEDSVDFEFTLNFDDSERSVIAVDDDSVDNDDAGIVDAESDELEVGGVLGFGAEEVTNYHIDGDVAIDGDNTTVETHLVDSDAADRFDTVAGDERSSGDLMGTVTMTHDDDVALVFYEEANTDIVDEDDDTYAVYSDDDDVITLHLGDEYEDDDEVEIHTGTHAPTALEDIGAAELADTYGEEMTFLELRAEFGSITAALVSAPFVGAFTLGIGFLIVRRQDLGV